MNALKDQTAVSLLLASQSPRRRELMALLGLPFDAAAPDVTETPRTGESPAALVARLSQDKARAVHPPPWRQIIVACDTIVALDGETLGKPISADEATAMLRQLRQHPHTVYSAVTLRDPAAEQMITAVAETEVVMRSYTDDEIAAYVASGDPLDKAGAYAIQHPGFHPVNAIKGCYANVVGLPLCHLTRCLQTQGVTPSHDVPTVCQIHHARRCPVHRTILHE
jgi:MAF protein